MAKPVCMGAMLQCTFGMAPATLNILDPMRPKLQNKPIGNIMDFTPMANIPSFGMCQAQTNPAVIAATAAAFGTPTPAPCIPVFVAPWSPGGKDKSGTFPMLLDNCKLMCAYQGQVTVKNPGHTANVDAK